MDMAALAEECRWLDPAGVVAKLSEAYRLSEERVLLDHIMAPFAAVRTERPRWFKPWHDRLSSERLKRRARLRQRHRRYFLKRRP